MGVDGPREAQPWRPIVAIRWYRSAQAALVCEDGRPFQVGRRQDAGIQTVRQIDGDPGAAREIAILLVIEAFGIRRTPFVAQAEVDC